MRLSGIGKRYRRFFETKEQAEKFIFDTKRSGSVELAELAVEEKYILGVIRQSQKYEPKLLLEAWQRFEKEEIVEDRNLTVQELAEKFVSRQKTQGRSARTLIDDRSRLKAMTNVMGQIRAGAIKRADILRYMEGIAPGTNRRSHHKTLRKFWGWANDLGHDVHLLHPSVRLPGRLVGRSSLHEQPDFTIEGREEAQEHLSRYCCHNRYV